MAMLIRMVRSLKISADGFTIVTVKKNTVYQLPDDLGRTLVDARDAIVVEANSLSGALPRANIIAGRTAPAAD